MSWLYDDAFTNLNKDIIKSIKRMYIEKLPITVETLYEDLKEKDINLEYLVSLRNRSVENGEVGKLAEKIFNRYLQNRAVEFAESMIMAAGSKDANIYKVLTKGAIHINDLLSIDPGRDNSANTVIDRATEEIKSGSNLLVYRSKVMSSIAGGSTKKEITTIGGRPGHGKTTYMLNILKDLTPKYSGLVFSREMTNEQLMKKLFVMESEKLSLQDLRSVKPDKKIIKEIEAIKERVKEKYKNVRFYDNIRSFDEAIAEIIRHKPDFFMDDFIQMVEGDPKMDRRDQINHAIRSYIWAAKDTNSHGFIMSQLNREVDKRIDNVPVLSDFAESSILEWLSETCLFVQIPSNINHQEYADDLFKIYCRKARYGKPATYDIRIKKDKCIIEM